MREELLRLLDSTEPLRTTIVSWAFLFLGLAVFSAFMIDPGTPLRFVIIVFGGIAVALGVTPYVICLRAWGKVFLRHYRKSI